MEVTNMALANICKRDILALLSEYPTFEGAKTIAYLLNHPGQSIPAILLEPALLVGFTPGEIARSYPHLAPIKMTDPTTLRAVDKRLNQLIAQKAGTPSLQNSGTPTPQHALDSEIEALVKYRRETTLPGGTIKCFHQDDHKAYFRLTAAISRLLNRAEKDGHYEAVAYIKYHLRRGLRLRWEE